MLLSASLEPNDGTSLQNLRIRDTPCSFELFILELSLHLQGHAGYYSSHYVAYAWNPHFVQSSQIYIHVIVP